jgi:hypothetical protein
LESWPYCLFPAGLIISTKPAFAPANLSTESVRSLVYCVKSGEPLHGKSMFRVKIVKTLNALKRRLRIIQSVLSAQSVVNLFRREGGDDFLEARVPAERVPKRQQFQLPVGDGSWWTNSHGELLAGEIFLAGPGSDHR